MVAELPCSVAYQNFSAIGDFQQDWEPVGANEIMSGRARTNMNIRNTHK